MHKEEKLDCETFTFCGFYDFQIELDNCILSLHRSLFFFFFSLSHAVTYKQTKYPTFLTPHVSCAKLLPEMDLLFVCTDLLNTYICFLIIGFILVFITIGYNDILLSTVKLTFQNSPSCVLKFSNIYVIYITLLLRKLS